MRRRTLPFAAALVVAASVMAGCSDPAPAPSPSGTGFATETEAFAAAEATYRAYVEALNRVDLSDPNTFEDVYRWTTGDLNATDREGLSRYHAEGYKVGGESRIDRLEFGSSKDGTTTLLVCLDVGSVTLKNGLGESQVSEDRVAVQTLAVELEAGNSPTEMLVSTISGRDGEPKCE